MDRHTMKRKCEWCGERGAPLNEAASGSSYFALLNLRPLNLSRLLTAPCAVMPSNGTYGQPG